MADGVSDERAVRTQRKEKKERLLKEEEDEGLASQNVQKLRNSNSAEDWINFARRHPDDFLNIIIDDFSSLRLVQALFVTASVGLVRSSMGKNHHGDYKHSLNELYLQRMGFVAALSVFCNLFGIVLAIFVSVQCRGMREMKADGEAVVAVMPRLFTLFYITMASFLLGMILMGLGVCILLFTTESWEMSCLICFLASSLFVILVCLLSKFSFGSSLATHSMTLAFDTAKHLSQDLEGAGFGAVQAGYGAVASTVTRTNTGKQDGDNDKDDEEKGKSSEEAGEAQASKESNEKKKPKEGGEAEASKESNEKPDGKKKEDGQDK